MANILYGVNGEGAGHSTRAKEVIAHLQASGHVVRVASFDRGLQNLRDTCETIEIYGLRFAMANNRVRYRRTVAKNLLTSRHAAGSIRRLGTLVDEFKIDMVITDFEPLTCHIAHRKRLPVVSIDNQHLMTNAQVAVPAECRRDAAAAKLVTRLMTPGANAYLVTSFIEAAVKDKRTFLVPPILRQEILRANSISGDDVLVYVTSPAPELAALLKCVRARFVAYGFGREGCDGNVIYKKPSLDGFLADLVRAKAVIANAGFSLVTESLHLSKPYLAIPVAHQFEQTFNAFWLDKMGYGAHWRELNRERIDSFLYNLPTYRERLARYPRQDNSVLFAKLDAFLEGCTSARAEAAGGTL